MTRTNIIIGLLCAIALGFGAVAAYSVYEQRKLSNELALLHEAVAQAQARSENLEESIAHRDEEIEAQKELIRAIRQQAATSAYDFSQIRQMIEDATQTVTDIKKLEEADPELLAKYSKVYFLNEHYTPSSLVYIDSEYVLSDQYLQIKEEVKPFLMDMLMAMQSAQLSGKVASAYRSYDYQGDVKHAHTVEYGTSAANTFSADQGYSEHQLGTTVDISTPELGGSLSESFENTDEYEWLVDHAHEYGFVLSYPRNNDYYEFEPWHWRFVGVELATYLHNSNLHFYDVPQRDINEYRLTMFDR